MLIYNNKYEIHNVQITPRFIFIQNIMLKGTLFPHVILSKMGDAEETNC